MDSQEEDNFIVFASETEELWAAMTWQYRDPTYEYGDVAEELATHGEAAAEVVLRNLETAVEIEYSDAGGVEAVSVEVERFGGEDNVPHIYRMLRKVGGKTAQEAISLLSLIDDADGTGRYEAILGESGTAEAIHVLVRRLSATAPTVATAAAAALHRIGAGSVPAVCARVVPVQGKSSTSDGIACARWLGDQRDPTALPTLVAALAGGDKEIALVAAAALGRIGHTDAVAPLLALLSPDAAVGAAPVTRTTGQKLPFETVRAAAAWALGRIDESRSLDTLVGAIGTYDRWTSGEAAGAVAALGGDPRAVLATLGADLGDKWHWTDRAAAVQKLGTGGFDVLMAATEVPEAFVRSLAVRCLESATDDADTEATARRREQATTRAATLLIDPSASVRFSAIRLLGTLNAVGRANLLLARLEDTDRDELGFDDAHDVAAAAADALPDDEETAQILRQALEGGRLRAAIVWWPFTDGRGRRRGMARGAEVIAPIVLRDAQNGDEDAVVALRDPTLAGVLADLDTGMRDAADTIIAAADARDTEREAEKRAQEPVPTPPPPQPFEPERRRAVSLHNRKKLDDDAYYWLHWGDADLRAMPLDLQQAWAEGPRAWAEALMGADVASPPHNLPVGTYVIPQFRAAVDRYMKSNLSAEDYAWYNAGERIKAMKQIAQVAWRKGPSAWAAFLGAPSPRRQG